MGKKVNVVSILRASMKLWKIEWVHHEYYITAKVPKPDKKLPITANLRRIVEMPP